MLIFFSLVYLPACSGWGQPSPRLRCGGVWERRAGGGRAHRDGPNAGGRTGGPSVSLYPRHLREKHPGCTHRRPGYGEYGVRQSGTNTHMLPIPTNTHTEMLQMLQCGPTFMQFSCPNNDRQIAIFDNISFFILNLQIHQVHVVVFQTLNLNITVHWGPKVAFPHRYGSLMCRVATSGTAVENSNVAQKAFSPLSNIWIFFFFFFFWKTVEWKPQTTNKVNYESRCLWNNHPWPLTSTAAFTTNWLELQI